MSVVLKVVKPPDRDYFTSAETIEGTVELDSKRASTTSQIVVYLEGRLKIAMRARGSCQESAFRKRERLLFTRQKVLESPDTNLARKYGNGPKSNIRFFKFVMEFPTLIAAAEQEASYEKSNLSTLPPSFSISSDVLKVSVSYTLRVLVKRTGFLIPNNTSRCNIDFRPLSTSQPCIHDHATFSTTVNYLSMAVLGVIGPNLDEGNDLPLYTPTVRFEVDIPSCKTIFPKDYIILGAALMIPSELRHLFSTIWVKCVEIRLRTTTTAVLGPQTRTHTVYVECCSVRGSMLLYLPSNESRITIPSEIWHNHTYPCLLQSLKTAEMQRQYQLEVFIEFAWGSMDNNYSVVNRSDIVVESDAQLPCELPPDYDQS